MKNLSLLIVVLILANGDFLAFSYESIPNDSVKYVNCVYDRQHNRIRQICDCGYANKDLTVPQFDGIILDIMITNCKMLTIRNETFKTVMQINEINFINIENLILEENSLAFNTNNYFPNLKVNFVNVVIDEIPSHFISGHINELIFKNSRIGIFRTFSITGIKDKLFALSLIESTIGRMEIQAIKRIEIDNLVIDGCKFVSSLPSKSFNEIEVTDKFVIHNSSFAFINSNAFWMKNISSLQILNSNFTELSSETFNMDIKKSVKIAYNNFNILNFGALKSIRLAESYYEKQSEKPDLVFAHNTINELKGGKMYFFSTDFALRMNNITMNKEISCDELISTVKQSQMVAKYQEEIYFLHGDSEFKSVKDYKSDYCMEGSRTTLIIAFTSVLAGLLVVVSVATLWYYYHNRRKRNLDIVMPEGKTYRETQIVVQIEHHGLLKTDL